MEAKITKITPSKTKKAFFTLTKVIGCLLLLVMALLWPFAVIWSLNTMFKLSVEYTFGCWLACWVLIFSLQNAIKITKETK